MDTSHKNDEAHLTHPLHHGVATTAGSAEVLRGAAPSVERGRSMRQARGHDAGRIVSASAPCVQPRVHLPLCHLRDVLKVDGGGAPGGRRQPWWHPSLLHWSGKGKPGRLGLALDAGRPCPLEEARETGKLLTTSHNLTRGQRNR